MRAATRAIVATSSVAVLALASGALAASSHKTAPAATFGVPVVVDFFHPGYEPDLAIDKAGKYKGSTFVSMPNGFSTTLSYLWRSDNNRRSFHMTEGNAIGKQQTCVGGGDTELQTDPVNGDVYWADLQGLTNFSNSRSSDGGHTWDTSCTSVPGVGVDRQWLGIDDNGGKAAVGAGANDGRLYFDYDNVDQDPTGAGNQLVMNESVDGVHYGNKCEAAEAPCALPPAAITNNEGIPGNIVVDNIPHSKWQHRVYAIHLDGTGSSVIVSWCSGKKGDNTAATVADDCTDPTQLSTANADRVNKYWHDSAVRKAGPWETGQLFPSLAQDTVGNLYAAWSEYPTSQGRPIGPGAIKVSVSRDGAAHWSKPVTISPAKLGNDVMPWIVAGTPGRIGIAWYGSTMAKNAQGQFGPDPVDQATWNLYYAVSTNALNGHPSFGVTKVSDHPVKYGDISTGGLGGTQDRSLGDFFQVQMGLDGQAIITYVDDTSADRNNDFSDGSGETPAEAAGPVMVVTQNSGPGLFAGKKVPYFARLTNQTHNRPGSAFYATAGQDIAAPNSLNVIGSSIKMQGKSALRITLSVADNSLASDLMTPADLGGPVATWMVRWAAPSYGKPGDGNTYYVGMQSDGGQAPTFYTGSTAAITTTHAKYFTYPALHAIKGTIQGGVITWIVPLNLISGPHKGDGLFSVTGFTSTQLLPASTTSSQIATGGDIGDQNIPNEISATAPYTFIVS